MKRKGRRGDRKERKEDWRKKIKGNVKEVRGDEENKTTRGRKEGRQKR